jgi:hypothetical protein
LIYLVDCVRWVRRGCVVFRARFQRSFRWSLPGELLANAEGGLVWQWPLPPLGRLFVVPPQRIAIVEEGIVDDVLSRVDPEGPPPRQRRFISFADLRSVEVRESEVWVNDQFYARIDTPAQAQALADELIGLARMTPDARTEDLIRSRSQDLDEAGLRQRLEEFEEKSRGVRLMGNLLWLLFFVAGPIVVGLYSLERTWRSLFAALGVLVSINAVLFFRAHRALFPDLRAERWQKLLLFVLVPVDAIRAIDSLAFRLFQRADPAAVAYLLCRPEAGSDLIQRIVRDLRYPLGPASTAAADPDAGRVLREDHEQRRQVLEDWLQTRQWPLESLLTPPDRQSSALSYCPRCREQFRVPEGQCEACHETPLCGWN